MANKQNNNATFGERLLQNLSDPMSITSTALTLAKNVIEDMRDTPKVSEMKRDIKQLAQVVKNPIPHNLVNVNAQICEKYPEVFDINGTGLLRVSRDVVESMPQNVQLLSLVLIRHCLQILIDFGANSKTQRAISDVGQAAVMHFAGAVIETSLSGD